MRYRPYMWAVLLASVLATYDIPRRLEVPRFTGMPRFEPEPLRDTTLPIRITLDGWAFYARAGGMVVATGQATQPFIYGCDPRWDGSIPFCRIGRTTIKMPNHAFIVVGVFFTTLQDAIRRARGADPTRRRYTAGDVFREGFNLKAFIAVLPLINFGILEHGAYGNLLVTI